MIVKEWTFLVLIGLLMNTADSSVSKYDWLKELKEKANRENKERKVKSVEDLEERKDLVEFEIRVPKSGEDIVIIEVDKEAKSMDPPGSFSFDSLSDGITTGDNSRDAFSQPKEEEDCDESYDEFDL